MRRALHANAEKGNEETSALQAIQCWSCVCGEEIELQELESHDSGDSGISILVFLRRLYCLLFLYCWKLCWSRKRMRTRMIQSQTYIYGWWDLSGSFCHNGWRFDLDISWIYSIWIIISSIKFLFSYLKSIEHSPLNSPIRI